ncbi:hypothetical protein CEXT_676991 [Caerostris extrusa]|uniref:Uncharacterized protein n=1 Tax=Caerostris extrusa TaxID=172846 RepID=A0AAV4PY25_CAEEX|nr:hypothetical protein CEXT_676991 [Caerostris extrusa]
MRLEKRRRSKKRDVGVGDKLGVSERKGRIEAIGGSSRRATGIRDLLPLLRVKKQKPEGEKNIRLFLMSKCNYLIFKLLPITTFSEMGLSG